MDYKSTIDHLVMKSLYCIANFGIQNWNATRVHTFCVILGTWPWSSEIRIYIFLKLVYASTKMSQNKNEINKMHDINNNKTI